MKAVLRLAALSAWSRRLTLGLTLVAIALAVTLLLAVERIRVDARQSFTQSVSGVDLVVGARTGGVQLMLYAVFHAGAASNNIAWDSYQTIATHPAVDARTPLDFVALVGDLTNEDADLLPEVKRALGGLRAPLIATRGNNDFGTKKQWRAVFGADPDTVTSLAGNLFVLADTTDGHGSKDCPDARWIERQLAAHQRRLPGPRHGLRQGDPQDAHRRQRQPRLLHQPRVFHLRGRGPGAAGRRREAGADRQRRTHGRHAGRPAGAGR